MKSAAVDHYRTLQEVLADLGIGETTLRKYRKILTENAPDQWKHRKGEHLYSPESYEALKLVRQLFKTGLSQAQIEDLIIDRGI